MRARTVAVALGLVLLTGLAVQSSGAQSADVTLRVSLYRNANGILAAVFSGTVASSAPNQLVDVLGRDCGTKGFRLISGTRTSEGGGWRVENPETNFPFRHTPWESGIIFQARSNGKLSTPVVMRLPAILGFSNVGRKGWRVYVSPPSPGVVSMKGKWVHLQRLRNRTWKTIARKKLVHKPSYVWGAFNHEVFFPLAARGWVLRAYLPRKSALPCYRPTATPQWRS